MLENKTLYLLVVLFSFHVQSYALSPDILSVDYSANQLSISGQHFGVKSPAPPILWDNFEYGADMQPLTDFHWTRTGGSAGGHISTSAPYSGTRSAYNRTTGPDAVNPIAEPWNTAKLAFPPTPKAYWSYRSKRVTTGDPYGQWKVGRFGSNINSPYSGPSTMMLSDGQASYYNDAGSGVSIRYTEDEGRTSWIIQGVTNQNWVRHEMYRDVTPVDGAYLWFAVGAARRNYSNRTDFSLNASSILLGMMFTNARNDGDHRMYIDDVYLDNTQARVELCLGATWATKQDCDPQIPETWTATTITAAVNTGVYTVGQEVFLYVVDADGNVNSNGYPLVIGETQAGLSQPLPPPLLIIN